jgi:hypothetical protein
MYQWQRESEPADCTKGIENACQKTWRLGLLLLTAVLSDEMRSCAADSESDTFAKSLISRHHCHVHQLSAIFQESRKDSFSFCTLAMIRGFHPCLRISPRMCGESGEMLDFYSYFSLLLAQVIRVQDLCFLPSFLGIYSCSILRRLHFPPDYKTVLQ